MKIKSKSIFALIVISALIGCSKKEDELISLIGQQITSQPVQNYLNKIGTEPEISRFEDVYYYIYKSEGIDFSFSILDTLETIHLYSESSEGHRQFQSEIPFGVTFNDTRKVIEKKLGPPDSNGGGGVINYYSIWDKKGILITYKKSDQEDMTNTIHHITLKKKGNLKPT
jgi:hypothetical protein